MSDVIRILLQSAEGSFLEVGVFVGAMLLFFGYLNYMTAGGAIQAISKYRRFQVLMGAVLGVSPGCGGAIFVMPLYLRGSVTYGTVVATLISTMGDSSFVIISKMPKEALYIHLISFVVGIVSGYVVDALGLGRTLVRAEKTPPQRPKQSGHVTWPHIGHVAGDMVGQVLHPKGRQVAGTVGYDITHRGYGVYWLVTAVGLLLGIILLCQQDIGHWVGFNLNRAVGLLGAAISIVWLMAGRHGIADDTHAELEEKLASLKQMLIHNAQETAFVTFWVFIAYSSFALFMHFTQLDLAAVVAQAGVLPIFATACIGLIPGCGPQIVTVTLYTKGVIPFSALVAHTLSQDGDALFPILAMNPRAAIWLTVTSTVPAVVIGVLFYLIGV